MRRNFDITTLVAAVMLLTTQVSAMDQNDVMPRLIVGINIDQLRSDYLQALQGKLQKEGLRKLLQDGVVFDNVTLDIDSPSALSALATLTTGCYPYYNGITGQLIFDASTLQCRPVFYDKNYLGNGTQECCSPKALMSSTLADELMSATQWQSHIYSIAPNANQALVTAGYSSNGAFWIDNNTGKWVSSTYYTDLPQCVSSQNDTDKPLFCSTRNLIWENKPLPSAQGCLLTPHLRQAAKGFKHKLSKDDKIIVADFKTTPYVNAAVTELAKLLVSRQRLGGTNVTDMLQVTYYAGSYQYQSAEQSPEEVQDIYIKLDMQIESLLQFLDKEIGLQNVMVCLMGTGDTNSNGPEISKMQMGEFNVARCSALLNSYLISVFGQGQWVDGYNDGQIYLNRKFIDRQGKNLTAVTQEAADFVTMMSGVEEVYTMQQLVHNDYNTRLTKQRNSYNKETGGDLIIKLQSGWTVRLDNYSKPQPQQRHNAHTAMSVIFAPSILKPKHISTPTEAIQIAPTVAKCLRIRAPSACNAPPVRL